MMRDERAGVHVRACDETGAELHDMPEDAGRQIIPCHTEKFRRAVSGLHWCAWCEDIGTTEIVHHNLGCMSLCTDCRCRFKRIRGENEQRDFGNELALKTLDRAITDGVLVVAKEG